MKNDESQEPKYRKELLLFEPKTLVVIILTSVLTLLVVFFGQKGVKFMASVLSPVPPHAPFDGTAFPVKQVPNWVKLSESERKMSFSQLPPGKIISIPDYKPTRLAIPVSTLKWNDPSDDAIRNEKITFPVPYLGTYKLDGLENTGSHPAVDIKIPDGTPIFAIANGTVIKAEISNGGFGSHIVLQHNDFPSLDDANARATLYSSYSHLSSLAVNVNDVVTKGQLIGYSGSSGTATTPHLHFQIDNDSPAWHPYWPFTNADMRAAGLSFFEAINAGLKAENARANTLNPLKYVQKYLGEQALVASNSANDLRPASSDDGYNNLSFVLQTAGGAKFTEGNEIQFVIQAFDVNGNLISNPVFQDEARLYLMNGNGSLNMENLNSSFLASGITSAVSLKETKPGREKLLLRFRSKEFSSPEFEIEKKDTVAGFFLLPAKTQLAIGETANVIVRALDFNGNPAQEILFGEVPTISLSDNNVGSINLGYLAPGNFTNSEATLIFTANAVGSSEIIISYHNQTFKSPMLSVSETTPNDIAAADQSGSSTVSAEASANAQNPEAGSTTVSSADVPFSDIATGSEYFEALKFLKENGLVAGYSDGTFKPVQQVSRAEAVTLILRAINEQPKESLNAVFRDVTLDPWFAKFIYTAFQLGFVKGNPDGTFKPDAPVNIAEFLTMLMVSANTDIDPQITVTLPQGISQTDWFAPFIQEAMKRNILENVDSIDPAKPLTRGEIAKMLYRLKQAELDSLVTPGGIEPPSTA